MQIIRNRSRIIGRLLRLEKYIYVRKAMQQSTIRFRGESFGELHREKKYSQKKNKIKIKNERIPVAFLECYILCAAEVLLPAGGTNLWGMYWWHWVSRLFYMRCCCVHWKRMPMRRRLWCYWCTSNFGRAIRDGVQRYLIFHIDTFCIFSPILREC